MRTSALRQRLIDAGLAFAWDEWAQMGVFAAASRRSPWAQDPEALVVFTLEIAREDPRLFDEVLDWLATNERLISTRRLRAMASLNEDVPLVEATLDWLAHRRGRSAARPRSAPAGVALFPALRPVAPESADASFAEQAFLRVPVEPSGKSQPPDVRLPINLGFRLRELLGVGARAEVVRVLLTTGAPTMSTTEIARAAGFARRNVAEALAALGAAGAIRTLPVSGERRFTVERDRWTEFLGVPDDLASEPRNWPQLLTGLRRALRWLSRPELDDLSDYLRASQARDLLEALRDDFAPAGIAVDVGRGTEGVWEALEQSLDRAIAQLTTRASAAVTTDVARPRGTYEIDRDESGRYRWRLRAANGQVVATSAKGHGSADEAVAAARELASDAQVVTADSVRDAGGRHGWRFLRDGDVVAVSADTLASRSNAMRAAARVRAIAGAARVARAGQA